MKNTRKPKIYTELFLESTSNVIELTEKKVLFFEEKYVLENSWISKKKLDLYLFRHKEIEVKKYWKVKLIDVKILWYLFKGIRK